MEENFGYIYNFVIDLKHEDKIIDLKEKADKLSEEVTKIELPIGAINGLQIYHHKNSPNFFIAVFVTALFPVISEMLIEKFITTFKTIFNCAILQFDMDSISTEELKEALNTANNQHNNKKKELN